MTGRIRVLIVDDSALMRKEIRAILESDPDIQVVGTARNGAECLECMNHLEPDLITLDINMPVMDGMTCLQYIMLRKPTPVIMLSSLTQEDELISFEALELGAVDFLGKPGGTVSKNIGSVREEILFKIKAAAGVRLGRLMKGRNRRTKRRDEGVVRSTRVTGRQAGNGKLIVIGQSTGGPNTIFEIIPYLSQDLAAALVIVQHMPAAFTKGFAERIAKSCPFPFKHAEAGDVVEPGVGYLAPGELHLTFTPRGFNQKGAMIRLSKSPEDLPHRPSVDVAMESAASLYGADAIGVLLTGMGDDGADGMVAIRRAGGRTIAESEETCVVFGMPKEAIKRGGAEIVLPSYSIAEEINRLVDVGEHENRRRA